MMFCEAFSAWRQKEDQRVSHEWRKWDGSETSAAKIVAAQDERITAAKIRLQCECLKNLPCVVRQSSIVLK
jgi:hypothetical protein